MLTGLRKLRPSLDINVGEDPLADGFVHEKQLVEGRSAWPSENLKVPDCQQEYYCPEEVAGKGERIIMKRGFQGPNGNSAPRPTQPTRALPH